MARAAAKRGKRAKQAARPAGKAGRVAGASAAPRRRPEYESQLFFGRMRRQTKWVFAVLAVVFALSFVFLGVGSGSSALTDILNGNIHLFGSGGGPSEKGLEKKVAKDPTNTKLPANTTARKANTHFVCRRIRPKKSCFSHSCCRL